MDRHQLESAGSNYPYLHFQGLYAVPVGLIQWFLVCLPNLEDRPVAGWVIAVGAGVAFAALVGVSLYYRRTFGRVTPTPERRTRYFVATAALFAVFIAADQLARTVLGRPPDQPVSTTAAAWALGMLAFYAVASALRSHHIVIWSVTFVVGVLPIWGLGVDRDALAYVPIGAAMIIAGLFDHRDLVRAFGSYEQLDLEGSDARA